MKMALKQPVQPDKGGVTLGPVAPSVWSIRKKVYKLILNDLSACVGHGKPGEVGPPPRSKPEPQPTVEEARV